MSKIKNMAKKWVRMDLSVRGASEGQPALIFRPIEFFGLLKIRPYDFGPFVVRFFRASLGRLVRL